jgi:hypothetical protein
MNNNDCKEKVMLCMLQVAIGISFKQRVFQKRMDKYHLINGG